MSCGSTAKGSDPSQLRRQRNNFGKINNSPVDMMTHIHPYKLRMYVLLYSFTHSHSSNINTSTNNITYPTESPLIIFRIPISHLIVYGLPSESHPCCPSACLCICSDMYVANLSHNHNNNWNRSDILICNVLFPLILIDYVKPNPGCGSSCNGSFSKPFRNIQVRLVSPLSFDIIHNVIYSITIYIFI